MIGPARAKTEARAVIQIKTASLFMSLGNLETLKPPQALDALVIDRPARISIAVIRLYP